MSDHSFKDAEERKNYRWGIQQPLLDETTGHFALNTYHNVELEESDEVINDLDITQRNFALEQDFAQKYASKTSEFADGDVREFIIDALKDIALEMGIKFEHALLLFKIYMQFYDPKRHLREGMFADDFRDFRIES